MKKNLITVLILALCVVNLILNIIVVFVCMPSARKTNNLITEIASVLDLELEKNDDIPKVALENIASFDVEAQVVNLKDEASPDGEGGSKVEKHYVQVGLTLSLDNSTKDYSALNTVLTNSSGAVFDEARNIIQEYTYTQINDPSAQENIKKQILKNLQKKYDTKCIYDVAFSKFTVQ